MGEQGAESIHVYFKSLARTNQTIPDRVERLHCMMKEHFLHLAPANIAARPPVKKVKLGDFYICTMSCILNVFNCFIFVDVASYDYFVHAERQ